MIAIRAIPAWRDLRRVTWSCPYRAEPGAGCRHPSAGSFAIRHCVGGAGECGNRAPTAAIVEKQSKGPFIHTDGASALQHDGAAGYLLTGQTASGTEAARSCFRLLR